jgi:signal peptidase I
VVIFINPNERFRRYMKRVVAMPGDTLEIKGRTVFINDNALSSHPADPVKLAAMGKQIRGVVVIESNRTARYGVMFSKTPDEESGFPRTVIPNGFCFVLGDNRDDSHDSRFFGPVPLADILGRVDYIYKPAETWSRFGPYRDLK